MAQTLLLLGIVDRFNLGASGPGARLRPLFQASADKMRWLTPEEEFPNTGVVSWWQPIPDAEVYKAWTFQVERSRTYEHDNEHHDFYGVKGSPLPAVELIDLQGAADPEDTRALLLEEGISLESCATKRLAFRDRSGSVVGPIDLLLREGRLFLDEKDANVPLNQPSGDLALSFWENHRFLPFELWPRRGGEVDYSPNAVFLKRVLREIRDMTPELIRDAKLTERLIGSYCNAIEKTSLSPLQRQRLKRLHKLAEQSSTGVTVGEEALSDLLSLPTVKEILSDSKEQAAKKAVEEIRTTLTELDEERGALTKEVATLHTKATKLREEIESSQREQAAVLASFDERVQQKFQAIGQDASSFLADVAVVRAALSPPVPDRASVTGTRPPVNLREARALPVTDVVNSLREYFEKAGLGCDLPTTLLGSWAAGYVPMVFGVAARDALAAAGDCLFGARLHLATLGPTLSSPTDLLRLPAYSVSGLSTVEELLSEASRSEDLFLLVFENINLCQLDSTLVPLLRNHVGNQGQSSTSRAPIKYATPAGFWSSNVLLAGIMIDSPLALPMSRELWTCSTFINASGKRSCVRPKEAEAREVKLISTLSYETWSEWLETIDYTSVSDTRLLAAHVSREVETGAVSKRLLRRLAAALDLTSPAIEENRRAGILAEMAVIPYLLSRGLEPDAGLKDSPADLSLDDGFIDMVTGLFEKWGLDLD